MASLPSIRVYQPIKLGGKYAADISRYQDKYRHSIKMYGGYWTSTWDMINMSPYAMKNFFKSRVGFGIKTSAGGIKVWEGLIWSMDYFEKGVMRRVTLDKTRNSIRCVYTDVSDDTRKETGWYDNDASQQRYGKIQEIVYLDKTTTAAAEAYAQTVLSESQIPLPMIIAIKEPKPEDVATLKVSAVGFAYTLNYQYLSILDSTVTIAGTINNIMNANAEFVTKGFIENNTVQVRPPDTETKAWDWMVELAEIGDGTIPYSIQVLNDRKLFYKKIDPTPTLKWTGRDLTTGHGRSLRAGIWSARPGIVRDLTWDNAPLPDTYFLQNQRDSFVSEVEASTEYVIPLLKSDDQPDSDMISALTRTLNSWD
jgi:hypothetical protein